MALICFVTDQRQWIYQLENDVNSVKPIHHRNQLHRVRFAVLFALLIMSQILVPSPSAAQSVSNETYYISPTGNDASSGKTESEAWATFDRALDAGSYKDKTLQPGDTLVVLDGTYYQSISPSTVTGLPGAPITIRAKNDGKAIIDGQGERIPVEFLRYRQAHYYVVEGIVARNGSAQVYKVQGDHNVFRRVSGYDADTYGNSAVFTIRGDYNTLEDCAAAGTGRKMILIYEAEHNTIRRCVADWREWDGREWCNSHWPWGEGFDIYGASFNIIENSIAFGHTPNSGFSLMTQGHQTTNGNKYLGIMSILSGMNADGTPIVWPDTRPQGSEPCDYVKQWDQWRALSSGIRVGQSGQAHDNLFQDIFAWGSARYGLSMKQVGDLADFKNNRVNRATIVNNSLNNLSKFGGLGVDAYQLELDLFDSVENSRFGKIWTGSSYTSMDGEGARLHHRYVDGVLMDGTNGQPAQPLWPWPMEDRIQAELGYSVTEMMTTLIEDNTLPPSDNPPATSEPTPTPETPTPKVPRVHLPYLSAAPPAIGAHDPMRKTLNKAASATSELTPTPKMRAETKAGEDIPFTPASTVRRVNVPHLSAAPPPTLFEPAIFWFGEVGPTDNHADVRIWHYDDYMKVAVHIIDRHLWFDSTPTESELTQWDAVSLYLDLDGDASDGINDSTYRFVNQLWHGSDRQAMYQGNGSGWTVSTNPFTATDTWRGNYPNNIGWDMGWQAYFEIPFASLSLTGPPPQGKEWRLGVVLHDRDDAEGTSIPDKVWPETADPEKPSTWGELHFGVPSYSSPNTTSDGSTTIRHGLNGDIVVDAHVGGHGNCGGEMNAWTEWPVANYAGYDRFNIQNQWDIADFMCFSKYYVTFPLDSLPANKSITSATVTLTLLGNAGYEPGQAQPSAIDVLTVAEDWDEQTINWNNAPLAIENLGVTWVNPKDAQGGIPYEWDVSLAVAEAYAKGQPLRLAFYSTDGERHSGKYFWTSEFSGEAARPRLDVSWGVAANTETPEESKSQLLLPVVQH